MRRKQHYMNSKTAGTQASQLKEFLINWTVLARRVNTLYML